MPGIGIGILILNEKNEVLLILRNKDALKALSDMHLEGLWTLPAGKVKMRETLFDAVIRKAKEEVNLEVSDLELISVADDINEYSHFVTIGFLAKTYRGSIDLGMTEEHVEYGFFPLDNLPTNLCLPSKKIITNYLNSRIYNRCLQNAKGKVFISQPMENKSLKIMLEERKNIVKYFERKGYEVLDSIVQVSDGTSIQYLARSIELLDKADLVVFMKDWEKARGCKIEYEIAKQYGKKIQILKEEEYE